MTTKEYFEKESGKLEVLARKYGTDKLEHGYIPFYEEYLPEQPMAMLEIGIAKGASALMWLEHYPDCDLHYIDLFGSAEHVTAKWCRERFIVPHIGDQGSLQFLATIHEQFDIIIDDGSHRADHQLVSFKHLFINNLKSGGVYVIEDCHCNKDRFYDGDTFVKEFEQTALWLFRNLAVEGYIPVHPYFNDGEIQVFENTISGVNIFCNGKLIFIWKK